MSGNEAWWGALLVGALSLLRMVVELTLLCLIGRGVLGLLAGKGRENNAVYRMFDLLVGPVIKAVRWLTPKLVLDRHLPWVAGLLLFWAWIGLAVLKRNACVAAGVVC